MNNQFKGMGKLVNQFYQDIIDVRPVVVLDPKRQGSILDLFSSKNQENINTCVMADSGKGMSYFCKVKLLKSEQTNG
jgi:hypothetical protein